jgi:hypothetical protein
MKTYQNQIELFGHEMADDIIKREKNPDWESPLKKMDICSSLSKIYDVDYRTVIDDMDKQINRSLRSLRIKDSY